ncbi:MAG: DNA-3-methyladenine glycosylase 2 family protein [Verrucomicrobia bacterium]|nr:DNA-3-methyladenine glycosylase 2 family protein [Verrucomicrobiota bacterium]
MRLTDSVPISLDLTLRSGQVFHWEHQADGSWTGLIGDTPVRVAEKNGLLDVSRGSLALAENYFALDHPLEEIYAEFPRDPMSAEALELCRGLRIIRQPRWECLATFITSSMKQVAHIRSMSLSLRKAFGRPTEYGYTYPLPEILAASSEQALRACGLGYRAPNLLATAGIVARGNVDLDALAGLETPALLEALVKLPGVGVKVANCVLLFAYERLDAVPIDVWIHRVLIAMRRGRGGTPAQLARYARKNLGPYAGYVQQYLFHRARVSSK